MYIKNALKLLNHNSKNMIISQIKRAEIHYRLKMTENSIKNILVINIPVIIIITIVKH